MIEVQGNVSALPGELLTPGSAKTEPTAPESMDTPAFLRPRLQA